ncbi:MAG: amino acid racemase [Patescibacteria group bacterium]
MRTAGIIGGLGPETTSKFYLEVVFSCFEKDGVNRPPMLIWNVPLPYQIEKGFIATGKGEKKYLPYLVDAARRLEKGGADFIVVPCNSVHTLIEEIRKLINIPVLSIVDETINYLKSKNISGVGILATSTTIRKRLYEDKLKKNNIKITNIDANDQEQMGEIINNLVHSKHSDKDKERLSKIIDTLANKGTNTILLACTDLQLIAPKIDGVQIIDTMNILVQSTAREILK